MEKLTENEKTLLKAYLKIELNNGGNKYTDVLLKLEKELENEESEEKEFFNERVLKQLKMVKRELKEFSEARENLLGTIFTLRKMVKSDKLNDYMDNVLDYFNTFFIGLEKEQKEARFFFEQLEKEF